MKLPVWIIPRKQTAPFGIVGWVLAIAPPWLMLAVVNNSVYSQMSDDISNSSAAAAAPSPAEWTQFLRDNMQRWNPYETVLGVDNVGSLQLKWKNPIGGSGAQPVFANGGVYIGSDDGNTYALNARTGAEFCLIDYLYGPQHHSGLNAPKADSFNAERQ